MATAGTALAVLGLLVAALTPACAAPLRFVKQTDLPQIGLRLKLMPHARETPPTPPKVEIYRFTKGTESWKTEMYAPLDLWRQRQHAGSWADGAGNTLLLARINCPLPEGFPHEHVSLTEYDAKATEAAERVRDGWTEPELALWVADFTGAKTAAAHPVTPRPLAVSDLLQFDLAEPVPATLAYAFRVRRPMPGHAPAPSSWLFARFTLAPGADRDAARQAIREKFFGSVSPIAIVAPAGPSDTFQNPATLVGGGPSQPFEASRKQVRDSIRNMKDWWYVETPHYIILSDLGTRHRRLVQQLQADIEKLRAAYAQLIPARRPITTISVIRVFAESEAYTRYVGPLHADSVGLWMAAKKELVVRPTFGGQSAEDRDSVPRATFHEAFHQYVDYAFDYVRPAVWFNEGHAVFFENAELRGGRVSIDEGRRHLKTLRELIESDWLTADRIRAILAMSYPDFYAGSLDVKLQRYAVAWGIVYYLRKGLDPEAPPAYAGVLDRYGDALWQTRDAGQATEAAFAGIDLAAFRDELVQFWKSASRRARARRNLLFAP
ncbi:MAG: DUF1570 domain-containing protein [Kiritimatiellae bacterium]|nr:DUF1570 domain-containing protein [Kiritimatiellia bacterium]